MDMLLDIQKGMKISVSKWGNSLGIRIPSGFVKDFQLRDGDRFEITQTEGALVLIPEREMELSEILSRITPENAHGEISWGKPVGSEKLEAYE